MLFDDDLYFTVPWEDIIDDICGAEETRLKNVNNVSLDRQARLFSLFS